MALEGKAIVVHVAVAKQEGVAPGGAQTVRLALDDDRSAEAVVDGRDAILVVRQEPFPDDETFGLVSQMRRAGVSVPANIAEGYGRGRRLEYIRHLEIARGSLFELQTHGEIARHEGWMDGDGWAEFDRSACEVDRVLSGLLRSLKRSKGPAKA